jgi:hypothetical protein
MTGLAGDCWANFLARGSGHPAQPAPVFATEAVTLGAALQDVLDALDHADARTPRRYDRSCHNLARILTTDDQ